jgi:hypothetical protein
MKRRIQVFIEPVIDSGDYLQLELFNDEQIVVNSSVQNISDISKVFTDFSQSFTVPASAINNAIFKHFYQSDIGDNQAPFNGLLDHNKRRKAYIEIDLTPFRRGKISLEKSNLKNGQAESYTITFYGDIRALKDAFGEQKLSDLDLSSLEFAFTGAEILNRITDLATDYDVRYPLIANNRLWTYHQGGSTDITNTAHAIQYDELFPAVKISKLFEAIEAQYGLTFTGTFLDDPKFTNVFLQAKNTVEYSFITETQDVDFSSKAGNSSFNWNNLVSSQTAEDFVDLATNTINIQNFSPVITSHTIQLYVYSISASATIYIDVYQDGNLFQTLQTATVGALPYIVFQNTSGLNTNITFKLRATNSITVGLNMTYNVIAVIQPDVLVSVCSIQTNTTALSGNVSLNQTLPEMKVADFFSGVLKQFNATCVGVSENVFEILPLDEWYAKGALVDVTEYTIIDSIDVERIKLYKKISFKYQESESFVNKNYFKTTTQHYGNVEYQYAYDGDEYIVESPFENLLFTPSIDNMGDYAILGYFLNETLQAYTPKPTLLYLYGESDALAHDIKFYNGSGHDNISSYALFGQDFSYQNTKYSLNFGADNSVIHEETIQNGLFATYYFPYLSNLFNLKNRLISVKTNLPISLLTGLRINDRIIIRDKRYIINEMKSNLTTGDVDFTLYLDFRPVSGGLLNGGKPIELDESAQCVDVRVDLPNGATQAELTCVTAGVTITPSTLTADGVVEICVPANPNPRTQLITEDNFDFITEEFENIITEETETQVITVVVTYTFWNGTQASNLIILQI